jgi:hypothetical protein
MRVSIDVEEGYEGRFHYLRRIDGLLRDSGVEIVFNDPDHDLLVIQGGMLAEREAAGGPITRPMLIYERVACAALSSNSGYRKLLKRDNVLGWLKETSFRDPALYNAPMVKNRQHVEVMARSIGDPVAAEAQAPAVAIDEAAAAKIVAAPPIHLQSRYQNFVELDRRKLKNRKVDVITAGTTEYGTELLSRHRYIASRAIVDLQGLSTIVGTGRVFPQDIYPSIIQSAKIFVSPYGYGEYSWKDFEAIYAGCVLVKPPMRHIRTGLFDIFDGSHHLEADLWYSNLHEIVTEVRDNLPDYQERTDRSRREILASREPERMAADFLQWFRRVVPA